ncbi:MAG: hypothetical protein IH946_03040 [Bacteroidetes bacterium]|nr:hypothetical protein [Bacteroidota bacterium]
MNQKIIVKLILIIGIITAIYWVKGTLRLSSDNQPEDFYGKSIYRNINRSNTDLGAATLIIGDSGADQLYTSTKSHGKAVSLTTNAAITMAGQYIFLQNALKNNDLKKVVLIYNPLSFSNNLDTATSYQYFIKPFYTIENKVYFDTSVNDALIPFFLPSLSQLPLIKATNWVPDFSFRLEKSTVELSPINKNYLKKISELTLERGIQFSVLPGMIKESKRNDTFQELRSLIKANGLQDAFKDYFNKMIFLEDKWFRDEVHVWKMSMIPDDPYQLK